MATAGIVRGLVLGWAVASASHTLFPATRAVTDTAQQTSMPAAMVESKRLREETKTLEQMVPRLADRGSALFLLAHDYARLGEPAKALDLLKQCVALDEGFNPAGNKAFLSLRGDPEFHSLVEQVRQRTPSVHRAHVAFTLEQNDLFPEALGVDASKRVFYMGSDPPTMGKTGVPQESLGTLPE